MTLKTGLLCAMLALGGACTPIVERHGFVPTQTDLAQIVPGQTTAEEARALLPAPTTSGPVVGGSFYYIYSEFRTLGAMPRREVDRQIVAIDVNGAGVVTGISRYGLRDGRVVPLTQRVTDDNIADVSFIRQLMGGIARFDPGQFLGG